MAGIVAAATASLQVARLVAEDGYFEKLRRVELDPASGAVLGAAFLAALLYFLLRRTGVLLRESRQPFRYTQVDKTPRDRFEAASWDRWALLHHDLTERLDQRIRRFSILSDLRIEKSGRLEAPRVSDRRRSSHIHIMGRYVFRDDDDGKRLVHVMPEVRIGPPGTPATLAQPVRYLLDPREEMQNGARSPAGAQGRKHYELSVEDYRQVLERVYSSIATEVYAQLDRDVREKIALFPTSRLRAVALYREAEDFARSNTRDAYERAIALYRAALRYFKLTGLGPLTRFLIRLRPLLWRGAVKYQHQWAHIVAGYARCLVYRRATSAQTGRRINPLYELPELLGEAIAAIEKLHNRIGKRRADRRAERTLAYFLYPPDSWVNRWRLRSTLLFELQKSAIFELYVIDAHVQCDLGNGAKA